MSDQKIHAVTTLATHHVKHGKEKEFDAWLKGIALAASKFDGNQGYIHFPVDVDQPQIHRVAFRFTHKDKLDHFLDSDVREEWYGKLKPLITEETTYSYHEGLEQWFGYNDYYSPKPAAYKMVVVVYLALLPVTYFFSYVVHPLVKEVISATWLVTAIMAALTVITLTYVGIPLTSKMLRNWLNS